MVWNQHHTQWFNRQRKHNILNYYSRRRLSAGNCRQSSGDYRDNRHHRNHRANLYYYFLVSLLAVTPAYADEPTVSNSANPVAAATGNVTNQAVQFQNNGAPSRQYFVNGNSCNGTTMTFQPFYLGGDVHTDTYQRTGNFGVQLGLSVPLDGGMVETCKQIARRHEQKMRLDYELVRALKCTEIMKSGFTFRPGSRVAVLCQDIVPIVLIDKRDLNW